MSKIIKLLMVWSFLSVLLSNYVVSGFFYTYNPLMLLIGYLYGFAPSNYLEHYKAQETSDMVLLKTK